MTDPVIYPPRPAVNRNILLDPDIEVLGDVHLGKKFITNIPLDRRGEREECVWRDFEESLMEAKAARHIQVGDLFDAFIVPVETVIRAADIYTEAASTNPATIFIVYAGNHDRSRTEYRKSSFELFMRLVAGEPNIRVFMDVAEIAAGKVGDDAIGIIPWHPFKSSSELASELSYGEYRHIFGHWDTGTFGGSKDNLIPYDGLIGKTCSIVSGHEHSPRFFRYGDNGHIDVRIVGSMQPYSHAEDENQEFYITIPLADLPAIEASKELHDMNVRFLLREGEVAPEIDALSISSKRISDDPEGSELADLEVEFESFDMNALLETSLTEAGVKPSYIDTLKEKFGELKAQ